MANLLTLVGFASSEGVALSTSGLEQTSALLEITFLEAHDEVCVEAGEEEAVCERLVVAKKNVEPHRYNRIQSEPVDRTGLQAAIPWGPLLTEPSSDRPANRSLTNGKNFSKFSFHAHRDAGAQPVNSNSF